MPFVYPDDDLSYTGNFLNMLFRTTRRDTGRTPRWNARSMFCSSFMRPRTELFGRQHSRGGQLACRSILRVGRGHGSALWPAARRCQRRSPPHVDGDRLIAKVPEFIKRVKAGETRLMGFGHRIYKNYDPRARIIKKIAYEVFELMGKNPLLEIALECERIALEDEYFIKRKLYPNVDFYTGLIYQSMGFPMTMFPVLFAIPRMSGWVAQWEEMLLDPEQKIARPRQIYLGHDTRSIFPSMTAPKRGSRTSLCFL